MTTFQRILASGERLPLERALALVQAAALAVDASHARQTVHGSLSPSSFRIDDDRVILLPPDDSPIACDMPNPARAYWSPQRHAGEPARRADDLYALGLIAEAVLTGRNPSDRHATTPTSPAPTIPSEIAAVLRAQRSWAPSERFASGAELARELSRAASYVLGPTTSPLPCTGAGGPSGDSAHPPRFEPAWAAARRVAQARAARDLALTELPDHGTREPPQPMRIVHHPIQHRDYPDLPLPGGWVVALVVVLCSVYLFPLYFMLFPHA